jgi:hypothetical protein
LIGCNGSVEKSEDPGETIKEPSRLEAAGMVAQDIQKSLGNLPITVTLELNVHGEVTSCRITTVNGSPPAPDSIDISKESALCMEVSKWALGKATDRKVQVQFGSGQLK